MKIARFEHRCRRCGETYSRSAVTPSSDALSILSLMIRKGPDTLITPHECTDGGYGVADLIGARIEESE